MIRVRGMVKLAGALTFGAVVGLGASTARAQVAVRGPVAPIRTPYYYGVNSPYGYAELYGPAYYGASGNGYTTPGRVGPGPVRDWSTGRPVRLAKPWMLPLPR